MRTLQLFLLLLIFTFSSCKKLVTVPAPTNKLVTTNVFTNNASVIAAQLGVYAKFVGFPASVELWTGLSSDELTNYSTNQNQIDLYLNNLNAQTDGSRLSWGSLYTEIYNENAIIENVGTASGISDNVKQFALGEAYFSRAYFYFLLVNLYGDVPLILTTNYSVNSQIARTPTAQVYQQMISDLKTSQEKLSSGYLDANDNPNATDKVRPTTWAADALLARVYLYTGDYGNAIKQSTTVIGGPFSLVSNLNNVFKMNSAEAIWQLMTPTGTNYTSEGQQFILTAPPTSSPIGVTASPQLLNAFEPNDARKTNWIGSYSSGTNTWYFPYKYKAGGASTSVSEYVMVLRLAEQYLIRAEAEANNNDPTDAVNDLNVIRNRAGLPPYSYSTSSALISAIQHERQVELFTEGHRWFDLKRTKAVDAVMSVVTPQKGGVWNSYQQLYPLNPSDLQYDPNLVQNSGY